MMSIRDNFSTIFLILGHVVACLIYKIISAVLIEDLEEFHESYKREPTDIGVDSSIYSFFNVFGYQRGKILKDTFKNAPFYTWVSVSNCNIMVSIFVIFDFMLIGIDHFFCNYALAHGSLADGFDTNYYFDLMHCLASYDCAAVIYRISYVLGLVISFVYTWWAMSTFKPDSIMLYSTRRLKALVTKTLKGSDLNDSDLDWMAGVKELRIAPDFRSSEESDAIVGLLQRMRAVEKLVIYWGRWDHFSCAHTGHIRNDSDLRIDKKDELADRYEDGSQAYQFMPELTEFGLCGNAIKCFPEFLRGNECVKTVLLQDSSLREIPEWISEFPNLTALRIIDSNVESLPHTLSECRKLRILDITGSPMRELPNNGEGLSLEILRIDGVQLPTIAASFKNLHNLKELYVKERSGVVYYINRKSEIPESIGYLSSLKKLSLLYLGKIELPSTIGSLANLEELSLCGSDISYLPDEICRLSKLTVLDLHYTGIRKLPDNIGELWNLTKLDLSCTPIIRLPISIGELEKLEILDLSYLKLEYIPPELLNLQLHHSVAHLIPVRLIRKCKIKTVRYLTRYSRHKCHLIDKRDREGYIYFWNTDVKLPDIRDFEKGRRALIKTYKDCGDDYKIYVMRDTIMNQYNIKQAGIVGKGSGMNTTVYQTYNENSDTVDRDKLLSEIIQIQNELRLKASTDDEYILLGKLSEAKQEVENEKIDAAINVLRTIGNKVYPIVEKIGCTLIAAIIKNRMGL